MVTTVPEAFQGVVDRGVPLVLVQVLDDSEIVVVSVFDFEIYFLHDFSTFHSHVFCSVILCLVLFLFLFLFLFL
jgi:hypothetical protein